MLPMSFLVSAYSLFRFFDTCSVHSQDTVLVQLTASDCTSPPCDILAHIPHGRWNPTKDTADMRGRHRKKPFQDSIAQKY